MTTQALSASVLVLIGGRPSATISDPGCPGKTAAGELVVDSVVDPDPVVGTEVDEDRKPGEVGIVDEPVVTSDGGVVDEPPPTVVPDVVPDEVVVDPGVTVVSAPVCETDPAEDGPDRTGDLLSGVEPGMVSVDGLLTIVSPLCGVLPGAVPGAVLVDVVSPVFGVLESGSPVNGDLPVVSGCSSDPGVPGTDGTVLLSPGSGWVPVGEVPSLTTGVAPGTVDGEPGWDPATGISGLLSVD